MSSSPAIEVRRADPADVPVVCSTLADGFAGDPVWGWVFDDDPDRRRRQHLAWFDILVAQGVENRSVWTTGGGEAAALWVPPGRPEVDAAREVELESTIRELCGTRAELILQVFTLFEENHPADPQLHYLSLLATADRYRGRGLGMDLLRVTLTELDRLAEPAYLESTNPVNLARYEAVGFRPYGSFALPGGPPVTTMWRDPQG